MFIFFFLLAPCTSFASKIGKGFEALSIYDYFKARKLFYSVINKKTDAAAAYGLALIYSRNDNPFFHPDSASKYAHLAFNTLMVKPIKKSPPGFTVDSLSIRNLCDSIAVKALAQAIKNNSAEQIEKFLVGNYLASEHILAQAVYARDEMDFDRMLEMNRSDFTEQFITTHPQSSFIFEASLLKDRQVFDEQTRYQTEKQYIAFLKNYPGNIMVNSAYEFLYNHYKKLSDIKGLRNFVYNYPNAPQINEAWKLFFALSVKSFSSHELEKFLMEHSNFPFKNSILEELELNKLELHPYEMDDYYGFIDNTGRIAISTDYDAVSEFWEGLAVAYKNDTAYFINKKNKNPFNLYFTEAYPFNNGMAPVKQNNKWTFINRQGQTIGQVYDEINEISNNAYIIKQNDKYGALDHFGRTIIEPRFYKLGDFKNEFAYYTENGKYGFVSKKGFVNKAEYEWISDFDDNNIALIKQNNHYGLVNSQGTKILEPEYEQILRAPGNIFVVVKNSLYGFFSGEDCFLSQVAFDFLKEKPAEFYSNGNTLKLLKKNEQALADLNGSMIIDFGTYEEIGFEFSGLIKVMKKNKYGFLDRKLNTVIPLRFREASDFTDGLAVVKLKDMNLIIKTTGKEIFSATEEIEKISEHYYLVGSEELINNKGEKISDNIKNIQTLRQGLLIVTLNNNEIKLLKD